MEDTPFKPRRAYRPIQVVCNPKEKALIQANAKMAGLPVSSFLRLVGQGYKVTGIVDFEHMKELTRINGDLARLGGLLKLWLVGNPRMKPFGSEHIQALLSKIDDQTDELIQIARKVASYTDRANIPSDEK